MEGCPGAANFAWLNPSIRQATFVFVNSSPPDETTLSTLPVTATERSSWILQPAASTAGGSLDESKQAVAALRKLATTRDAFDTAPPVTATPTMSAVTRGLDSVGTDEIWSLLGVDDLGVGDVSASVAVVAVVLVVGGFFVAVVGLVAPLAGLEVPLKTTVDSRGAPDLGFALVALP